MRLENWQSSAPLIYDGSRVRERESVLYRRGPLYAVSIKPPTTLPQKRTHHHAGILLIIHRPVYENLRKVSPRCMGCIIFEKTL